jgi:hypothetical protein
MTRIFAALLLLAAAQGRAYAEDNLLKNPDFEKKRGSTLPQQWEPFSSDKNQWFGGLAKDDASKGGCSVAFINASRPVKYQGLYQTLRVKSGARYEFSAEVALNPDNPLSGFAYGQLSIEWRDAQGKEIDRSWSHSWGPNLPKGKWSRFVINEIAPPRAAKASFVITLFSQGETTGSFLVDDARVVKADQ